MQAIYIILAIILVIWLGAYALIGIAVVVVFALLTNRKSASNNEVANYSNNKPSTQVKQFVPPYTPQSYFEISNQQGEKIQAVIDALMILKDANAYKFINRLQHFHLKYLEKRAFDASDLYDYTLKAANERITTAKRDFVKRECEAVIRIIELLKEEASTDDIVRAVLPPKEDAANTVKEEIAAIDAEKNINKSAKEQSEYPQDNGWEVVEDLENHPLRDKEYCRQLHQRVEVLHQKGELDKEIDFIRETVQSYESAGLPCRYWQLLLNVRIAEVAKKENVELIAPIVSQIIASLAQNAVQRENIRIAEAAKTRNIELIAPIVSQIIASLAQNAVQRENVRIAETAKTRNAKLIAPAVSQIVVSLANHAVQQKEEQAVEAEQYASQSTDWSNNFFNRFGLTKQDKYDDDVCPTEGVPYWEHTYVYSVADLQEANNQQRQFYDYFKAQFLKERYLDIEDNSNYAFVLMFDLANDYKKHKDYELLKQQLERLAENYPVVAQYINITISKVVTTVNQEEAESSLQSYDKSRGQLCRWVTSGETIEVQGFTLT